jgi:hypothetical protein
MKMLIRTAGPNVGYGLALLGTLFLGNIGLLLATLPPPTPAAAAHLMQVLAFAIVGSLAAIFVGLNINKSLPLADHSAMLWLWLLGLPVSRRLAEIALSVRWDQGMALEAGLLAAAVVIVMMASGRLTPERGR